MLCLENRELYGLQITQAIEEASNGTKKIRIGSLYPTLHNLEKKGLVQSRWGDDKPEKRAGARRRYYTLTSLGKATVTAIHEFRNNLLNWQPT
ncbi:transcriptional regulator, PadR family [Crocosphaera watsonii WH 0003]|uniref:Transcriptional regulator, PadR family n=1 Tax=Crocosphaera watsonii WH 0003 TaxID=423471 RepID=G5J541_CROWT|nr:transcriptional regulator, PadR family [Crocosphaera watsonii WH 0003]